MRSPVEKRSVLDWNKSSSRTSSRSKFRTRFKVKGKTKFPIKFKGGINGNRKKTVRFYIIMSD